ncbi:hypothetical protein [Paenibacillus xylaniclasticus]|uniref:hypothetical protein n=1 Tax=Paenibacillus xylaniclasticus TaxID=588083 RepID=UPI000FDC6A61|nr:hypothetical protein [Paenibacillus xylaniclasticus]GFN31421.1 hypothetical protein PCURB6_16810 [Paenibacillus curdlanolyticus]
MKIKTLAVGIMAAAALLVGGATVTSSISTPVAEAASITITLRPGQVYDTGGLATKISPSNAIVIDFNQYIHALQPGTGVVDVYKNGVTTRYNVLVTN